MLPSGARGFLLACLAINLAGSLLLCAVSLAFNLEPVSGDLARLGGYSEKDFGWRDALACYQIDRTNLRAEYDRPYDVVVIGDSFSEQHVRGWQNRLIERTGWSLVTLREGPRTLANLEANPVFRQHPPSLIIVETVERNLAGQFSTDDGFATNWLGPSRLLKTNSPRRDFPPTHHLASPTIATNRPIAGAWNLDIAKEILLKDVPRRWFNVNLTPVASTALTRGGLFSSEASSRLLFYGADLLKKDCSEDTISRTAWTVNELRNQIRTRFGCKFVLLVAPDKLTAYGSYLLDGQLRGLSILPRLQCRGLDVPRVDVALSAAIARGERDVYLPDDTHWGPSGARLAADALLNFLVKSERLVLS